MTKKLCQYNESFLQWMSKPKPKQSLEQFHRFAGIGSDGELYSAKSGSCSSSGSTNSGKLSRRCSSLEDCLRDQRENMGLPPLQSGDISGAVSLCHA